MLKKILKKIINESTWHSVAWYRQNFGLGPALWVLLKLICSKGLVRAPCGKSGSSVCLRSGTKDLEVFDQIFTDNDYELDLGSPDFIVDGGAHIGLASVFFANKYPKATIVAIEPEAENYTILLKNVKNYSNVKPICAGLWDKKCLLSIVDPGFGTWGYHVKECTSGEGIPALSIGDILSDFDISHIDLLKLDIEGAEIEVLNSHESWMSSIGTMIIELHERFRPGCASAFNKAISDYSYDRLESGENIVLTSLKRKLDDISVQDGQ